MPKRIILAIAVALIVVIGMQASPAYAFENSCIVAGYQGQWCGMG